MTPRPPPHTIDATGIGASLTPVPMALKLIVVSGPDEGREAALDSSLEIGSDPSADFVLGDPSVSRRHLKLTNAGSHVVVQDLGSRNGTFLGGTRLKEADVPLGAILTLGKTAIAIHSRWYRREVAPSASRRFGELIAESVAMREIFAILERVADSDVTVLIEGESGTGKELVARSIHGASIRSAEPYVVFDCGSVPPELAESELFGHKRGAFSGASADRAGAFQRAHGGTICLDELGELPLELQPKLLRVLETGEIKPVGDDASRKIDVRVVAATNRDLNAEARRGRFRSDLLYRLEVVRVRIPPLRHRPEDVPGLVEHLLAGKLPADDQVEGENLAKLMAYTWPGNVRELRNVLARAVTLSRAPGKQTVAFADLVFNLGPAAATPLTIGSEFPGVSSAVPYKEAKAQVLLNFDRAYVTALLDRHRQKIPQAAEAAGLSRKHLYTLARKVQGLEEETDAED